MPTARIEFTGSLGHPLAGRLDTPDGQPRGWAVFAHCFTCSKDTKAATYVARGLAEAGFGVLRFDFTGLGGSGGDFGNTDFSSNVDDLVAAADWLRGAHGVPSLLVGHSLGGAAVLAAAHRIADARALVTLGAPFEPAHVMRQLGDSVTAIEAGGQARVSLGGREFEVRREFLHDVAGQPQAERIHSLGRPLLILHAPGDRVVGVDNARRIFERAMHPKSFVALDEADHLLSREADARYAAGIIASWAARYLPAEPALAAERTDALEGGTVRVSERGTGAFAVSIQAGRHSLVGDEPVAVGGDNLGPNPYELLLAALGACTVMTLRMYARQKQWPLANAHVTLTHDNIHAADCGECETKSGKVDRIERTIELEGALDEAQRARLMEIADKCPVHRTLHSEVQVVTRALVGDAGM
jgi:putative redox protein